MKKYKLTEETCQHFGRTLYRIEALKDFGNVKKGDLGGFIEKEINLSHNGNCWVSDDAKVYGNAIVSCNARVYGFARVFGNARVFNTARVYGNAEVFRNALVCGNAQVFGNARGYDDARVYGNTRVFDNTWVSGNAQVSKTPIQTDEFKFSVLISDFHVQVGCKQFKKEEVNTINYCSDFDGELYEKEFKKIKKYILNNLNYSLFERICNYFRRIA